MLIGKKTSLFAFMSLLLLMQMRGLRMFTQQSFRRNTISFFCGTNHRPTALRRISGISHDATAKDPNLTASTRSSRKFRVKDFVDENGTDARQMFFHSVQAKDYEGAVKAVDELTAQQYTMRDYEYLALLGVCNKAEHLPRVLEIIEKLKGRPTASNVSAYVSLIRCYTDAGQLNEAMAVIQDMVAKKFELRSRLFQPLLEALSQEGCLQRCLSALKYMLALKVPINEEQMVPLLSLLRFDSVRQKLSEDPIGKETLHTILGEVSHELLGVYHANALEVLRRVSGLSAAQVEAQGILVETAADIPGEILEYAPNDGRVRAMNATYPHMKTLLKDVTAIDNEHDSITRRFDSQTEPAVYTVLYENKTRTLLPIYSRESQRSDGNNNISSSGGSSTSIDSTSIDSSIDSSIHSSSNTRHQRVRLVDISSRSCRCPNCDRQVVPLGLTEADKVHVRDELFKLVRLSRGNMLHNLNDFGRWLRARDEYEFIVDGANVAYNSQNFDDGRFSFEQIERVVDRLAELGKRALVVVPGAYVSEGRVPNHSSRQMGWAVLTAQDHRVIKKLRDADQLFVVPSGSNDDWYWLYATLYEGRRSPAFVVSNDYMRDHRAIFADMKAFMRWRSQQIVYFRFNKGVSPTDHRGHDYEQPEVSLFMPEKISREMQRTGDSWHIPTMDRDAWLCVDLSPPGSINSLNEQVA